MPRKSKPFQLHLRAKHFLFAGYANWEMNTPVEIALQAKFKPWCAIEGETESGIFADPDGFKKFLHREYGAVKFEKDFHKAIKARFGNKIIRTIKMNPVDVKPTTKFSGRTRSVLST